MENEKQRKMRVIKKIKRLCRKFNRKNLNKKQY